MTDIFPTDFAKAILQEVELYPTCELHKIKDTNEKNAALRQMALLKEFQQMAMYGAFENCLKVYHKTKPDEKQEAALKLVYDLTGDWAKGYMSTQLLARLSFDKTAAQMADVLFTNLGGKPGSGTQEASGLTIMLSGGNK